jgi:hypothetical protein
MLSRFSDSNFDDGPIVPNQFVTGPLSDPGQDDPTGKALSRWEEEQLFEEDLRAVLNMLRPNRAERLLGWSEYRTGGNGFRATISWDPAVPENRPPAAAAAARRRPGANPADEHFVIPQMTDVLESILIGAVRNADELAARHEFEIYREVVRELHRRLDEMQRCYE